MTQVSDKDMAAIKDWLAKEPTLPKDFDDLLLKKFLFSCHCSLERTKKCITDFCTGRATTLSELYTNRDPKSPRMQTMFEAITVTTYLAGNEEILIHSYLNMDNFEFYDCLKSFTLVSDQWLAHEREKLPESQIIILDLKLYTLMLVAKVNIFYFQKFLIFLLEAMPVRLKQIHAINCPPFYEYLYGLVKGILPQEVRDIVHFHTSHLGLHQFIEKKYLPTEYGGEAESMVDQSATWVNQLVKNRSIYLNDNLWKADVSKKVKNGEVDTKMNGSFRTLAID